MDVGEVNQRRNTYTEVFDATWPYYVAMGMTYEQFWECDPNLTVGYRKVRDIQRRQMNEQLWLQGIYVAEALASTVGNMFTKGNKHKYPEEPLPITRDEVEERKERERLAKIERIKAGFTAKALTMNAKMGAKANDE